MMIKKIFFLLLFISMINIGFSHNLYTVYNNLKIDHKIISYNISTDYFNGLPNVSSSYFENNIKVKNNGKLCTLENYNFNKFYTTFNMICRENIENLSIKDVAKYNATYTLNKIYRIDYYGKKAFEVGVPDLSFNLNIDSSSIPSNKFELFSKYLSLGIMHILTGLDHIFFILGFVLLSVKFKELLKSITGFTLSHSFTLTLSVLGILVLSSRIVEPIIALSIVVVGILSIFKKFNSWFSSFTIIFLFGFFHGLGFAGSISEVGFPKTGFILSLFGFNLGIEIGQLIVVFTALLTFYLIRKIHPSKEILFKKSLSYLIILGGTIWFIQRLII